MAVLTKLDGSAHNGYLRATLTATTGVTVSNGDGGSRLVTNGAATKVDTITVGLAGDHSNYIIVGAGNNVITTAGSAVGGDGNYITAGDGNNTITVGANNGTNTSSYVTVGNGNNKITLGDGGAKSTGLEVQAGNGNNTITLGNNAGTDSSYVEVGTGNNTIVIGNYSGASVNGNYVYIHAGSGINMVTLGTGIGFVDMSAGAKGFNTITTADTAHATIMFADSAVSSAQFASLTSIGAGEILDMSAGLNGVLTPGKLGAKVVSGVSDYQTFLDQAASGDGSGVSIVKWFVVGGNTYIVEDNDASTKFTGSSDLVIQITGVYDLSAATITAGGVLTIV
jgi:S-layer protein